MSPFKVNYEGGETVQCFALFKLSLDSSPFVSSCKRLRRPQDDSSRFELRT